METSSLLKVSKTATSGRDSVDEGEINIDTRYHLCGLQLTSASTGLGTLLLLHTYTNADVGALYAF